jgi:hypothetical protein
MSLKFNIWKNMTRREMGDHFKAERQDLKQNQIPIETCLHKYSKVIYTYEKNLEP